MPSSRRDAASAYLQDGETFSFGFRVDAASMEQFAALSGDRHPLHTDRDYAISRGFDGPVVYGALLVAQISRLIGEEIRVPHCVWNSLRIDFRSPLYVDQEAVLEARVVNYSASVAVAKLKFSIASSSRAVAVGSVDVMVYDT